MNNEQEMVNDLDLLENQGQLEIDVKVNIYLNWNSANSNTLYNNSLEDLSTF